MCIPVIVVAAASYSTAADMSTIGDVSAGSGTFIIATFDATGGAASDDDYDDHNDD